ncbi:magnesium transporter CorA family protein [Paracoccus seriniphilus]|uniref:Magnesium transporter n=1 Tax=Paracoccus seriniphilus TaxID=184748 RepID=A0A239Q1J6_9RHOB|nr:magnesium transporter CorA family protein [Paracoccus seriniphilus]WCR14508.1 magnesium transporter CorA family protein [Paracoccus seriniphilus]SNT76374.1 magnesium transporter [Paracoccus seriniphilus]
MLYGYVTRDGRIAQLKRDADLAEAIWIDMIQPTDAEIACLRDLGVAVPSLADMEEIEISNRLYRENGMEYMTAVLPGDRADGIRAAMPVTFILSEKRLVTVRHHSPRPFLTFPERAERSTLGCSNADRLFVGLLEEIIARLADILEASGRLLDETSGAVFERRTGMGQAGKGSAERLQQALRVVGREAELMARVRLGLLSIERILAFSLATATERREGNKLRPVIKAQLRDVQALEVHADFLSSRVSLTVDTILGMINLEQNNTVRILSVIAALFLPPTLIASMYGMNFANMPELDKSWGYPMALGLMLGTSVATWLFLRWKNWL